MPVVFGLIPLLVAALQACNQGGEAGSAAQPLKMFDCQFQRKGLLHLHLSESRGSASVITAYTPGQHGSHTNDIREGRESEGRLVPPGETSRYAVELFLLNDQFGQAANDQVMIRMAADGRTRIEARPLQGQSRVIDFGTCSSHPSEHR